LHPIIIVREKNLKLFTQNPTFSPDSSRPGLNFDKITPLKSRPNGLGSESAGQAFFELSCSVLTTRQHWSCHCERSLRSNLLEIITRLLRRSAPRNDIEQGILFTISLCLQTVDKLGSAYRAQYSQLQMRYNHPC
jgi:hypothetical protein